MNVTISNGNGLSIERNFARDPTIRETFER